MSLLVQAAGGAYSWTVDWVDTESYKAPGAFPVSPIRPSAYRGSTQHVIVIVAETRRPVALGRQSNWTVLNCRLKNPHAPHIPQEPNSHG
jgi:hypothetical protein